MEFIREIIDSDVLDKVLPLPRSFHDRKVEILVFPIREQERKIYIDRDKINELMEGSVTQSLIGAIPHSDMSLDEIRSLRLQKYDSPY
jgi:hypothetical protein